MKSIKLPSETHSKIKVIAALEHENINSLVNSILIDWMKKYEMHKKQLEEGIQVED